jgi:thioredoxin-dependent peroxiredoxin
MRKDDDPMLTPGNMAPSFEAVTVKGESIRLEQWRGQRVVLNLLRYSHCPFCSLHVWYLSQRYPYWVEQGGGVIVVMESNAQETRELVDLTALPFPVIPDPQGTLYKMYHAQHSLMGALMSLKELPRAIQKWRQTFAMPIGPANGPRTRMPAQFFIDERGIIVRAWYAKHIDSFLPLDEMDRFFTDWTQKGETVIREKNQQA